MASVKSLSFLLCFVSFCALACAQTIYPGAGGSVEQGARSGEVLADLGVPGVLEFHPSFVSEASGALRDRLFVRTGRLGRVSLSSSDRLPSAAAEKVRESLLASGLADQVISTLDEHLGLGSAQFGRVLAGVDASQVSQGVLAFLRLTFGSAPVLYLDKLTDSYKVPQAAEIGGQHYVFGFQRENAEVSYYDCIRYAVLLAQAQRGKVYMGFDHAFSLIGKSTWQSLSGQFPETSRRNPTALKVMATLERAGVPYSLANPSPVTADSGASAFFSSFQAGDILTYTPMSTRQEFVSSWEEVLAAASLALALEVSSVMINEKASGWREKLGARQADQELFQKIDSVIGDRLDRGDSALAFVNASLLTDSEWDLVIEKAAENVLRIVRAPDSESELETSSHAFRTWLSGQFVANVPQSRTVSAVTAAGKPVQAQVVVAVPQFHVAFVTKVANGEPVVFQIDGANPATPSTFERLRDVIRPGAFMTRLTPRK